MRNPFLDFSVDVGEGPGRPLYGAFLDEAIAFSNDRNVLYAHGGGKFLELGLLPFVPAWLPHDRAECHKRRSCSGIRVV
jgi:hypothetical protein